MKTYLLLRNNRQSGPFTLSEILREDLRAHDLVWVEGQSASWRYPAELDELKGHVPPPVPETPVELGFNEVQNRVVPNRSAQVDGEWMVVPRISSNPGGDRPLRPFVRERQPSLPAALAVPETSVPAFDALAGVWQDDDLMPTMAWQAGAALATIQSVVDVVDADTDPALKPAKLHPVDKLPKIRVVLPAAVADKTMVVIRRRDPEVRPPLETRSRLRRPVLEFIPDESPVVVQPSSQPANMAVPVDPQQMAAIQVHLPGEHKDIDAENAAGESEQRLAPGVPEAQPETVLSSAVDPVLPVKPDYSPLPVSRTLQVNVRLVQKVAMITAIISLVAVAILIANAVFNPDAYNYNRTSVPQSSQQVKSAAEGRTVKP